MTEIKICNATTCKYNKNKMCRLPHIILNEKGSCEFYIKGNDGTSSGGIPPTRGNQDPPYQPFSMKQLQRGLPPMRLK